MTNDKLAATGYTPTRKLFSWHFWTLAIFAFLIVITFGVVTSMQHDQITAQAKTISSQAKTIKADKSKISDLKSQVQSESDRADACAAASAEWKKSVTDETQEMSDIFTNLFNPAWDGTADDNKVMSDITQAKKLDEACGTTGNQS